MQSLSAVPLEDFGLTHRHQMKMSPSSVNSKRGTHKWAFLKEEERREKK